VILKKNKAADIYTVTATAETYLTVILKDVVVTGNEETSLDIVMSADSAAGGSV
jgi:hypothetical protein